MRFQGKTSDLSVVLFIFTAGIWITVCEAQVGDCNMTYFISEGFKCQGNMVANLKNNPLTNCSYEHEGENACMKRHIQSCLTGHLSGYADSVAKLLMYQLFHCGDVKFQPSPTNTIFLNLIKCKQAMFEDADFCWKPFRDRLNSNRSDPLLCREYAIAKDCRTEKAKANCEICQDLQRDPYNPFCPDDTDPNIPKLGCDDVNKPLSCETQFIYKSAMDCDKTFVEAFMGNSKQDCGSRRTELTTCLDEKLSACTTDISNKDKLDSDIEAALSTVLRGRRYFCDAVTVRKIDVSLNVRPLIPCTDDYFVKMEKCALPLRETYATQNTTGVELCRAFNVASKCSNEAQDTYCAFDQYDGQIIQDPYSLVCTVNTRGDAVALTAQRVIQVLVFFFLLF